MSYHTKEIPKGHLGEISKIEEEYEEFQDAVNQNSPVLELCELADLLGAIEAYSVNHFSISLADLIKMKDATKRSFESGERK